MFPRMKDVSVAERKAQGGEARASRGWILKGFAVGKELGFHCKECSRK